MKITKSIIVFILFVTNSIIFSQKLNSVKYFNQNNFDYLLEQTNPPQNDLRHTHSFYNILGQVIVGGIGSVIAPAPFVATAFVNALGGGRQDVTDLMILLSVPAYLFATSGGVHWIASKENSKHNFWETFKYASVGMGVGVGIVSILSTQYTTIPGVWVAVSYTCPLIFSIIYSTSIAEWPTEISRNYFENSTLTLQEIHNREMIFNINILRVNL